MEKYGIQILGISEIKKVDRGSINSPDDYQERSSFLVNNDINRR